MKAYCDCGRSIEPNDDAGVCIPCGGRNLPVKRSRWNLLCWWFGCQPDYEAMHYCEPAIPCLRCGAGDTTYEDRIGQTRHARAVEALARYTVRPIQRLLPSKCQACGKRRGHCADCDGIPF